jgi:hypothetical protein
MQSVIEDHAQNVCGLNCTQRTHNAYFDNLDPVSVDAPERRSGQPVRDGIHPQLHGDVQRIRETMVMLTADREKIYSEYMCSLSRWNRRERRMKHIIEKQKRLIIKLKSMSEGGLERVVDISSEDESSESISSSTRHNGEDRELHVFDRISKSPPWGVDMDDIRRQLAEIDESIFRVEQAKSGLNRSTYSSQSLRKSGPSGQKPL